VILIYRRIYCWWLRPLRLGLLGLLLLLLLLRYCLFWWLLVIRVIVVQCLLPWVAR